MKEVRRLIVIIEQEKERVEQIESQVIELEAENENINEMNTILTMATKTNHQQKLVKTMEKEKDMKQMLVTDNFTL